MSGIYTSTLLGSIDEISFFFSKGQMGAFPYLLCVLFSFCYCSRIHRSMHIVKNVICSMCTVSHSNSEIRELKTPRFYS